MYRKISAKQIRGNTAIKKLITEVLTEYHVQCVSVDPRQMFHCGFRGFIARSEKELLQLLDECYETINNDESWAKQAKKIPNYGASYFSSVNENKIRQELLTRFEKAYDDIFEKIALQ